MDYNQVMSLNVSYLNYMIEEYELELNFDTMIKEFSGIFLTQNSYTDQDSTFRLMGTYITKKGEKTKKKQLYSLGSKKVRNESDYRITQIKKDFEKFVLVFSQLKYNEEIKKLEVEKEALKTEKRFC